jgi:hypothetical protein
MDALQKAFDEMKAARDALDACTNRASSIPNSEGQLLGVHARSNSRPSRPKTTAPDGVRRTDGSAETGAGRRAGNPLPVRVSA